MLKIISVKGSDHCCHIGPLVKLRNQPVISFHYESSDLVIISVLVCYLPGLNVDFICLFYLNPSFGNLKVTYETLLAT